MTSTGSNRLRLVVTGLVVLSVAGCSSTAKTNQAPGCSAVGDYTTHFTLTGGSSCPVLADGSFTVNQATWANVGTSTIEDDAGSCQVSTSGCSITSSCTTYAGSNTDTTQFTFTFVGSTGTGSEKTSTGGSTPNQAPVQCLYDVTLTKK